MKSARNGSARNCDAPVAEFRISSRMTEQHARLDRASLVAAISTVSIVGIGLSLTIPLLSMRLEQAQVPAWFNGVNTAVAGLATLVGAPFVPRVAQRVGVWRQGIHRDRLGDGPAVQVILW